MNTLLGRYVAHREHPELGTGVVASINKNGKHRVNFGSALRFVPAEKLKLAYRKRKARR